MLVGAVLVAALIWLGITWLQERARWGRILEALRLVPRQEEALLALRKQHLSKLHQIYHQRQSLNMQVGQPPGPPCHPGASTS